MKIAKLECRRTRRMAARAETFTPAERETLDAHAASCRPCAARLSPLDAPLRALLVDDAQSRAADWEARVPGARLARSVADAVQAPPVRRPEFGEFRALAAACVLVALLAGVLWMRETWSMREGVRASVAPASAPPSAIESAPPPAHPAAFLEYATLNGADARATEYHCPDGDATVIWLSSAS